MKSIGHIMDEESGKEYDSNLLIRVCTLTKGPLLSRRKEIRKAIVLAALSIYQPDSVFEMNELSINIKNITKCEIDDESIISILSQLSDEKILTHIHELKYKLNDKVEITDITELLSPAWNEFLSFLEKQYPAYDPYFDRDARELFDWCILKVLTRFIDATSQSIDNQLELLPIDDFKSIIEKKLGLFSLSKQLSKKYPTIMYSYLTSKPSVLLKTLFDCYSGIINVNLVLREQEIPKLNFDNIKFLVVDTSFLVGLLCKTDPIYPLSVAVANRCVNLNIPLYYTSQTKNEMMSFIDGSVKEMDGLINRSGKVNVVRSQFVADFRRQTIRWSDYITIISSWTQILEKQYGIVVLPEELERTGIDDDVAQYIKKTLPIVDNLRKEDRMKSDPNYKPRYREETQITHDAYCVGLISNLRKKYVDESKKIGGPWFLTFDNLLTITNAAYSASSRNLGFTILPRTLLNYLLIYSKILFDEKDKEEMAEAIIKFTVRTPDPKLTVDEYSRLVTYKFGLDQTDIEVVKEILFASPLREELKTALERDRGDIADDVAYRIFSDTHFVESVIGERKTGEKLRNVADKLKETEKKLVEERAARETLERSGIPNVSVITQVNTNIELDIKTEVSSLIQLLEGENAFKDNLLEKPSDISTKEKMKNWLENIKETIETSTSIGNNIKSFLPLIIQLLGKLGGM